MAVLLVFTIILSLLSTELSFVFADIGTATAYHPPYLPTRCNGNRQDQFPPGNLFVAVGEGLWDNGAACGRRYRMRCISGNNKPCKGSTIDVKVVDFCRKSPCPSTIVLSNDAFQAISRVDAKINVEYVQYASSHDHLNATAFY
ncbi:expansin-like EG45 domain-containing protein [Citrus sinensis]|uniref:Expansin-like EG45 domain-containing protein n=2 Tax=Citrus sinensis TaxID=2711 RepID=A0ACB8NNB4_CITSI|nr:expansin-like EG45 domain-containing protein [Citrus sinensis]KAH9799154.1 expansin-like EG45 domain-containing protein [Citrus sinensis]KAH9799183.1 expansin-like EG45 domain-containing protein [Citrus sinensis]